MKHQDLYCGKPVDELSVEELQSAVRHLGRLLTESYENSQQILDMLGKQ